MSQRSQARAVRGLVARFRRQQPLRSGSLLITILGDAIVPRGGAVTLGSLIALAEPFGLNERLVRTSVGRLAKDGWLTSRRSGRLSEYELTRHGRSRFAEATHRIYGEGPREWDGHWTMLLVPEASAARRERIREEMGWQGFGQLGPNVLAHPSQSVAETHRQLEVLGLAKGAIIMRSVSSSSDQDLSLISAGWNFADLAKGYRRFIAGYSDLSGVLSNGAALSPEQAFITRTLLIQEYRKVHLRDPLLPQELLPDDWVGTAAYSLCQRLYRKVFQPAEAHVSTHARKLSGVLQPASSDALARFGGLPVE